MHNFTPMWVFFGPKCVKKSNFSILQNFQQADVVVACMGGCKVNTPDCYFATKTSKNKLYLEMGFHQFFTTCKQLVLKYRTNYSLG